MNSVYGLLTVTVNHAQYRFRPLRSGNIDVRVAARCRRTIVENAVKIIEMAEFDHHSSTISITQISSMNACHMS